MALGGDGADAQVRRNSLIRLYKVLPVVFGLFAGLAGAFVGSRIWNTRASATTGPPPRFHETVNDGEGPTVDSARAAGRKLVEAAMAAQSVKSVERPESAPGSPHEAAEQEGARRLERYRDAIAAHRLESFDATWAPQAKTSVVSALKAMEKASGFSLGEVDCRSTSCVAGVEWPSEGQARKGYRALIYGDYGTADCATEIHMPVSSGPGAIKGELLLSKCRR